MENNNFNIDSSLSPNTSPRTSKIAFSGKAGEFFGIWIVNLLLSIVTLGIYSAWAKVRTTQYFYGHTRIENQPFRYLATPMQILKGRIIAVIIFALYSIVSSTAPMVGLLLIPVLIFLSPWLIVQSLKFNMRMTSYRNVCFSFNGTYGGALKHIVLLAILSALTLYLALPWALKKIDEYICSNIAYGGKQFQVNTNTSTYYTASLIAIATAIGVMIVLSIIFAVIVSIAAVGSGSNKEILTAFSTVGGFVLYLIAITLISAIYQTRIRNHLFGHTTLPDIATFKSDVKAMSLLWITTSNLLAIILTLGLAYPWAKIRKAAYLASATTVAIYPQADTLVDQIQQQGNSAFGEEAAGLFDVDVSLA
jgi:uncharacterized membrane protein YjgN (DUF898 family)